MLSDRLAEAAEAACGGKLFIWGGDGERQDPPENQDNDQDQDSQDDNPDDSDSDDDRTPSGSDNDGDDSKDDKVASAQEQLDQLKRDNIALKKANSQLKTKQQKAEADKDAAKERDEIATERDQLKTLLNGKFLEWSVQTFSDGKTKYDWVDLEDVTKAIDPEAIDIDMKTGKITGLDMELKRIAKRKPHWLKKDEQEQEDAGPTGQRGQGRGTGVKADAVETKRIGEKFKIPGFGSQNLRAM